MTSFPATKGFTDLPVKTIPRPLVSVGKSFQTVCGGLGLFSPSHRPWCDGNMYAEASGGGVCVCMRVEGRDLWNNLSIFE